MSNEQPDDGPQPITMATVSAIMAKYLDPARRLEEELARGTATATKVWKVECPCGTNWVYDEFNDSLPDACENCGRMVEIIPGELAMDSYSRSDLAVWLGVSS